MFNPWGKLGRLPHWSLVWATLPAGIWATVNHSTLTITMRPGLTQAERRSTLAHELEHVRRGYRPPSAREELICDQGAARKLIGIRPLGEALVWASCRDELADELWVDRTLLDVRLDHLHPSELHYLRRRVAAG